MQLWEIEYIDVFSRCLSTDPRIHTYLQQDAPNYMNTSTTWIACTGIYPMIVLCGYHRYSRHPAKLVRDYISNTYRDDHKGYS